MRFRLKASQHEQADKSQPLKDVHGNPTGRFVTRKYKAGDVVESDIDLAARFGSDKFEPLGGQAAADARKIADLERQIAELKANQATAQMSGPASTDLLHSPAVAPGGQVSTGFQGVPPAPVLPAAAVKPAEAQGSDWSEEDLDQMTVAELRELAADEGVELHAGMRKEDIVRTLRTHKR